ncbi:hypothetical protein AB8O53_08930 [Streptomyces pilosus]
MRPPRLRPPALGVVPVGKVRADFGTGGDAVHAVAERAFGSR